MKLYAIIFVLAVACAVNGQSDDTTNTTTIASPTEDVTTTTPNTTLTTPEVTTNHSLTASVSTQEPNTTVPTTAPTTTASVVTTVGPPSKPTVGKWRVNDTTHVCIMVNMAVQLALKYKDDSGKDQTLRWNFPNDSIATGNCAAANKTQQVIHLDGTKDGGKGEGVLTMTFGKDSDKNVIVQQIVFDMKTPLKEKFTADKLTLFKAKVGNSYLCNSNQTSTLTSPQNNTIDVSTIDLQVQAFMEKEDEFGDAQECAMDAETSNIVPIAVGAALAALVVIVLIAYLISRNRNKRGYESV